MQTVTTIGLDIAKSVFRVHGVDAAGQAVVRRQLKRRHILAFFEKLSPWPAHVKPHVMRQKKTWLTLR
jgi:transposase